jgi:tetratricopeptide (TPR) repeat protein
METTTLLKGLVFVPKLLAQLAQSKIERSQWGVALFKSMGVDLLKANFESIYAHALVEYGIEDPTNKLWIEFFSLKETAEYIKAHLYQKPEKELNTRFDGLLHRGQGAIFLQLKNKKVQTADIATEYGKLKKHIEAYTAKSTSKDLPQAQSIELSREILMQIETLKETAEKEKAQNTAILGKLNWQSEHLVIEIGEIHKEVRESQSFLSDLAEQMSEAKTAESIVKQVAEKIYNIENVSNSTFTGKEQTFYIDKYISENYTPPKLLTTPPFSPPVFEGREADLEAVHDKLFGGENFLLLVNGQGGMGKTSFAAKYWERYQAEYNYLAFLFVAEGIAEAMMNLTRSLGLNFTTETPEEQTTILIETISRLDKPCLLILDNANDEEDLNDNLLALRKCQNCHILLTSRLAKFEGAEKHPIGSLSDEKALQVFRKHYALLQESEIPLFYETYEAIGKNTLVLELLAKNLTHFNSALKQRYSLQEMLNDLQNGLTQLSQSKAVKTAYQAKGTGLRNETPEAIILSMYDLTGLSEAEIALLSVFAVLPAENIAFEALEKLLKEENLDQTLLTLAQKGWIEQNETDFKVSPVVQEITRHKNAERLLTDCQALIDVLQEQLQRDNLHHEDYKYATLYSHYAESIANIFTAEAYLEEAGRNMVMLYQRCGDFYKITGNLGQSLALFEEGHQICEKTALISPKSADAKNVLAISYQFLGNMHSELGNLDKALQFFEKQIGLFEQLYADYPSNVGFKNGLAISSQFLGNTHSSLGNLDKALQFFEKYFELNEQLYADYPSNVDFKNGLAISYEKLGQTHSELRNLDKALQFFEKYFQLNEELYRDYPSNVGFKNGLAISYSKLGQTHSELGNLDKALQFFEKRSQIGEELYADYPSNVGFKNGLAVSYSKLGQTHSKLDNLDKALQFFEKLSDLFEQLYVDYPSNVGFKDGLAISYSKLGQTHSKLGNLDKALQFFEKQIGLFEQLYADYPSNVGFKNGLAISSQFLGNTHSSLGNLDKALQFFEKYFELNEQLYADYPSNVDFKNGLAISYERLGQMHSELGDLNKALQFFEKRSQIGEELYADYPSNVGFKNGLAVSYSKLGEMHSKLGNLEKALQFFEKDFELNEQLYADCPSNVRFKNGLAISYAKLSQINTKLNQTTSAKKYMQEAERIFGELARDFPAHAQFKQYWEMAKDELASL